MLWGCSSGQSLLRLSLAVVMFFQRLADHRHTDAPSAFSYGASACRVRFVHLIVSSIGEQQYVEPLNAGLPA